MSKKKNPKTYVNYDSDGKRIPAYQPAAGTKKDVAKTSVGFTALAIILYVCAFVPLIAVSVIAAVKAYELMPYYSFWPFIGVVLTGVFGIIFMVVVFVVSRKNSPHSIRNQTVKIAITFTVLTSLFGVLMTYVFPDVIANATQGTIYCEDLYYNGDDLIEGNAALERDFIMYNVLNGNLNQYDTTTGKLEKDFSYYGLEAHSETNGVINKYTNSEIDSQYRYYMNTYKSKEELQEQVIDVLEAKYPYRYELYECIYNNYVLNDYDYCFYNNQARRAIALSILDYEIKYSNYEQFLTEGFVLETGNTKLHQIFVNNYDSFNLDGYVTFDDEGLLLAQMTNRMTIPVVVRLILNEGWSYTTPQYKDGEVQYNEGDGSFLYEIYDADALEAFKADGGEFEFEGELMNADGTMYSVNYGYNEDGWQVYENGIVKRPMYWLVLDMLGDPMAIATLDLEGIVAGLVGDGTANLVMSLVESLLETMPEMFDAVGELVQEDLGGVIENVCGGCSLGIGLCVDDDGAIAINVLPTNCEKAMLGYMQATWVSMDNVLLALINVMGLRNWLLIFGAIGIVLVVGAGVAREMGKKTRDRSDVSQDRLQREKDNADYVPDESTEGAVGNEEEALQPEMEEENVPSLALLSAPESDERGLTIR